MKNGLKSHYVFGRGAHINVVATVTNMISKYNLCHHFSYYSELYDV